MLLVALALHRGRTAAPPPRPMQVEVVRDAITDRVSASATLVDRAEAGRRLRRRDYRGIRVRFSSAHWVARPFFVGRARPVHLPLRRAAAAPAIWVLRDRGAPASGAGPGRRGSWAG